MGGSGVCWPEVVKKEVQAMGAVVICGRRPEDSGFGRWGGWTQARFCIFVWWKKKEIRERREIA
jgi:hypothetical protein